MPVRPPQQPRLICVELMPGERQVAGGPWCGLLGGALVSRSPMGSTAGAGIFPPLPAPSPTCCAARSSSFSSVAACSSVPRTLWPPVD